jgi:hypothetical protein
MRPPVSPLSTTTTRRTSCTLATRIPPNYEPGSRFRVLAPDGSEVDVTVPAGAEAGDMIQHRRRRLRGRLLRLPVWKSNFRRPTPSARCCR